MAVVIYVIGVVLCILAALEILKWNINPIVKILVILVLIATSWIGLLVYYLWGRTHLEGLLK